MLEKREREREALCGVAAQKAREAGLAGRVYTVAMMPSRTLGGGEGERRGEERRGEERE